MSSAQVIPAAAGRKFIYYSSTRPLATNLNRQSVHCPNQIVGISTNYAGPFHKVARGRPAPQSYRRECHHDRCPDNIPTRMSSVTDLGQRDATNIQITRKVAKRIWRPAPHLGALHPAVQSG